MHLLALISPEIDSNLLSYKVDKSTIKYFYDSLSLFNKIKNQCIFLIPKDLLTIFLSLDVFKPFLSSIYTNTQSGIILHTYSQNNCKESLTGLFSIPASRDLVYSQVIDYLQKYKIPMLILENNTTCQKYTCNNCSSDKLCRYPRQIPTFYIENYNKISSSLQKLSKDNTELLFKNPESKGSDFIPYLTKLMAIFYCPEILDYDFLDNIIIDNNFLSEALHCKVNLEIICFTLFRALTFPSSTDRLAQKHPFSIDWHPNDPACVDGFNLYRIDVLPPNKTGRKLSGPTRMLIAKKDSMNYLLSITDQHDFKTNIIQYKIDKINK